ncbi:DNA topoisomerase 4 subunit B [compost metagenome]
MTPYAKRGHKFTPTDLREGLVGVVNVKLTGVKFHNQEKSKLVDERAAGPLRDEIIAALEPFFAANSKVAELLCERATSMASLKQEFRQNKKVMKVLKDAKRRKQLPFKLCSALSCTNEERELFLVEGDSAGGSAKGARDSAYQEVLPLKGKIINPYGPKAGSAIENAETLAILMALGYDPSLEDPFANLRVGRVILLMDADVDGLHIQNLVIATFVRFVPGLINEGRVYIAKRYEYMTSLKGEYWFASKREELLQLAPKASHGNVMHLKGLGEVGADVLAEMAFNPAKRSLTKLLPLDSKQIKRIGELAGTDSAHKKELLGVN